VVQNTRYTEDVVLINIINVKDRKMQEIEFIRHLVDFIKSRQNAEPLQAGAREGEAEVQAAEPEAVEVEVVSDGNGTPNDAENPMDRDDTFVPPLQAKIEMMKKLTAIPPKSETLQQSQQQGGPAPAEESLAPVQQDDNNEVSQLRKLHDLLADDPTET